MEWPCPGEAAAALAAGMLRKSSSGGGAVKRTQGLPRHLSNPSTGFLSAGSTKTWDMGRASKNNNPLNSIGLESHIVGAPGVDPDYVMQLVNDVRTFADVLLNLKKAFQSKGQFKTNGNLMCWKWKIDICLRGVGDIFTSANYS